MAKYKIKHVSDFLIIQGSSNYVVKGCTAKGPVRKLIVVIFYNILLGSLTTHSPQKFN
ncbi:MAG: hypothetical protein JWR61_5345 [Ferruginibacter sp.]|nr:hypothetical protein [Ferruginibacter sp.]